MNDLQVNEIINQLKDVAESLRMISQGNTQIITNFITGASSLAAMFAAFFSFKAVKEMESSRLDEFRPILKWGGNQSNPDNQSELAFNFENQGKGPAHNIGLYDANNEFIKADLTEGSILSNGVECFAIIKDQRIFERLLNTKKIIIKYEDVYQRKFETHITVDIKKDSDGRWIKSVKPDFKQILKGK